MSAMLVGVLTAAPGLLASAEDRLRAIESGFSAEKDNTGFLLLIGAGLLFILVLLILSRYSSEAKSQPHKPQTDYFALTMHQLRIRSDDRKVLRLVAERAKLEVPAAMLLSPQGLSYALEQANIEQRDPVLTKHVRRLGRQIFGCDLP